MPNRATHTKISVQIKILPMPYGQLEYNSTVPKFGLGFIWAHTPVITGASSFLGVKRLGHWGEQSPNPVPRPRITTIPPFSQMPSWHAEGNLLFSLPYVYFYLNINMYLVTNFILNNPEYFPTHVNSRNEDRLHRLNANLSFREFCLLRWH